AVAVDLADILDRAGEARPPAARHDQPAAGALGRLDRPVVARGAVQPAEVQIPLLLAAAKDESRGVEAVVDERRAAVAAGVVLRQENGVWGQWAARLPVGVQRLHEGQAPAPSRPALEREVRV